MKKLIAVLCAALFIAVCFSVAALAVDGSGSVSWTIGNDTYSGTVVEALASLDKNGGGTLLLLSDVSLTGSCKIDYTLTVTGDYTLYLGADSSVRITDTGSVTLRCNTVYDCAVTNEGKLIVKCTANISGNGTINGNAVEYSHNWGDGTVYTAPTAEENGLMQYICADCSMTKFQSIPATGNKKSNTDAVTATLLISICFLLSVSVVCAVITKITRVKRARANVK